MAIITVEKKRNTAAGSGKERPYLLLTLDDPDSKVNTLNATLFNEFTAILDELESDQTLTGALLVSGKPNNFVAGADIGMFPDLETAIDFQKLSLTGHEIMNRIASFSKPVVACIHGSCLGGGAELALACRYRVISNHGKTKIGFPEVKLGLLPGMGGTQRLPRQTGIQHALTYMLTGKNMYSRQAFRNGFADEMVNRHNIITAGERALHRLSSTGPENGKKRRYQSKDRRPWYQKLLEASSIGRAIIFRQAMKKTLAESRGNYPAPPAIIESVRHGYKQGLVDGLQNEARLFGELAVTPESRELVRLFFATNNAKKNRSTGRAQEIGNLAVLGAGLMGSGIAGASLDGGYHVWLKDQSLIQAAEGERAIFNDLQKRVDKRIISLFERDSVLSRLHPVSTYEGFRRIQLVVEAVFEDLEVKRAVLREVEAQTGADCIFASNTSSIPISRIAEGAKRPENILGMHYFSPVQKMPLLEIVKTEQTADNVTATACQVGIRQGKMVIVVNDGPGFYTTRILAPYMNEALLLLEEGAAIEQVDRAMKNFGFPVGPFGLLDEVGIDVGAHVADVMGDLFDARNMKTSRKARELSDAGYKGRKNGMGFYSYGGGSAAGGGNPAESSSVMRDGNNGNNGAPGNDNKGDTSGNDKRASARTGKRGAVNTGIYRFFGGSGRRDLDESDIQERISAVMINEALYCLQENILQSPEDGDLGAVLGLGFPPFLGGPFRYVDRIGAGRFSDRLKRFHQAHGNRFRPAGILSKSNRFY